MCYSWQWKECWGNAILHESCVIVKCNYDHAAILHIVLHNAMNTLHCLVCRAFSLVVINLKVFIKLPAILDHGTLTLILSCAVR